MHISKIEIENFRSIEKCVIECEDYNCFVGPNGSGKSTVLNALNVFFGEITSFSDDDFFDRKTEDRRISICLTFDGLSQEAQDEFSHYVRDGRLVVTVTISKTEAGGYTKSIRGQRLVFEPFIPFFERSNAKEGKEIFDRLREKYSDLDSATNESGREAALNLYEEGLPEAEKKLVESGDEFFGASKGSYKLQRHVQWVYIPAVKDATTESEEGKSSHLGRLIQHTIRAQMSYEHELEKIRAKAFESYNSLLDAQREHLGELEKRLSARLQNSVTSDAGLELDWKKSEKSVAVAEPTAQVLLNDKGFSGEVESFGHGLQRSFLIAILQELMSVDSDITPTLLLGCEEPELYQHPPQAKHLASILMELSNGDAQMFVTTHSPYFIDVEYFEGIKMFRNVSGKAVVSSSSFENLLESYNEAFSKPLQNEDQVRTTLAIQTQPKFNEIFFADKVVLVEGISDQAHFETYMRLAERRSEFQRSGTTFVVCEGKSSLALMLIIATDFEIPYHVIFDCDSQCREQDATKHIRDNDAIFQLAGLPVLGKLPDDHIFVGHVSAWKDDIEAIVDVELGANVDTHKQAGRTAVGNLANCSKNPLYVAATIKAAWDAGERFPVLCSVFDAALAESGHSSQITKGES